MPETHPEYFAAGGSIARPSPGEAVPIAVVETIARMLGEHWASFGKQWEKFGVTLEEINAKIAELTRASHEAPCRDMQQHMRWHQEQARENRAFRRAVLLMLGGAIVAAALACLGRLIV